MISGVCNYYYQLNQKSLKKEDYMEFVIVLFWLPIIFISFLVLRIYLPFRNSEYKIESGNGFFETHFNKGNFAEYLIFRYLEKINVHSKIMTNLYIPREDGTTTEVDVMMISTKGIFVFESKNYSGWIFGDEKNPMWTQTLPGNNKNQFYNPIWQNSGHISAIRNVIGDERPNLYMSYIVFSERCTLKKISVNSSDVVVLKRNEIVSELNNYLNISNDILTEKEVFKYYYKLRYYRTATDQVKKKHIESIKDKRI